MTPIELDVLGELSKAFRNSSAAMNVSGAERSLPTNRFARSHSREETARAKWEGNLALDACK
jgi:hypothetical protein